MKIQRQLIIKLSGISTLLGNVTQKKKTNKQYTAFRLALIHTRRCFKRQMLIGPRSL